MLSTLYLLKYNNYYNRVLKKKDSLSEYLDYQIGDAIQNVNFNPNDGVWAKQVINWNNDIPDYLLVVSGTNTIVSRWFVIESRRLLSGQFEIELFRDSLADYLDNILEAPMFIEKGYCSIDDSAIYNEENISVNQIKEREILLKDKTDCAWVVGYCALKDAQETQPTRIEYGISTDVYDYYTPTLEDWDFYQYVSQNKTAKIKFPKTLNFKLTLVGDTVWYSEEVYKHHIYRFNEDGAISYETSTGGLGFLEIVGYDGQQRRVYENITPSNCKALYNKALSYYGLTDDQDKYNSLQQFATKSNKAKRLKVGNGATAKYYTINLVRSEVVNNDKKPAYNDAMYLQWKDFLEGINTQADKNIVDATPDSYDMNSFITNYVSLNYYIELIESTPSTSLDFYFPFGRKSLTDAPYCMFAIPYGELDIFYSEDNSTKSFTTVKENAISLAAGIAKGLGSKLYDIQLLPYCPIPLIRNNDLPTVIDFRNSPFSSWVDDEHYVLIESSRQILFFCEQSSDSFNIPVAANLYSFTDSLIFKTNMITQSLRLCSPNYNGIFEFNAYKNKGLNNINVDYTYKPFQPYIHLNPDFGGLYGKDFDDARGLILGGDFSLPITSDAWINYQIQNKTYQEQFNRQIQNMQVQHDVGRTQDIVKAITGTAGAGTTGAMTGTMIGGHVGGAIGGAIGAGISAGGGIADYILNERLRNEAMDYTKDLFSLQLDNIKALPDSLTRVSSFNANNKIFPFIEVYNATDIEVTAVANKLKYNGFTIGRIDTLNNIINNKPQYMDLGYFKGQLIRLETVNDDFHIVNIIASELNKGVYI